MPATAPKRHVLHKVPADVHNELRRCIDALGGVGAGRYAAVPDLSVADLAAHRATPWNLVGIQAYLDESPTRAGEIGDALEAAGVTESLADAVVRTINNRRQLDLDIDARDLDARVPFDLFATELRLTRLPRPRVQGAPAPGLAYHVAVNGLLLAMGTAWPRSNGQPLSRPQLYAMKKAMEAGQSPAEFVAALVAALPARPTTAERLADVEEQCRPMLAGRQFLYRDAMEAYLCVERARAFARDMTTLERAQTHVAVIKLWGEHSRVHGLSPLAIAAPVTAPTPAATAALRGGAASLGRHLKTLVPNSVPVPAGAQRPRWSGGVE